MNPQAPQPDANQDQPAVVPPSERPFLGAPPAPVTPPVDPSVVDQPQPAEQTEATELADPPVDDTPLAWQATEYIHHHKGVAWYLGLVGIIVVLLVIAVIFHLWLSIGVFAAMGAALVVYAHKPPRVLNYRLDTDGVSIDDKSYPYKNFRSFGVVSDTDWHAIDLEPTQRFMPRLTVLFGDDDFDAITEHLEQHLPRADRSPDIIERLSRYLRF